MTGRELIDFIQSHGIEDAEIHGEWIDPITEKSIRFIIKDLETEYAECFRNILVLNRIEDY
jgi:hypothetical protein